VPPKQVDIYTNLEKQYTTYIGKILQHQNGEFCILYKNGGKNYVINESEKKDKIFAIKKLDTSEQFIDDFGNTILYNPIVDENYNKLFVRYAQHKNRIKKKMKVRRFRILWLILN
jgi:hypothetical protein